MENAVKENPYTVLSYYNDKLQILYTLRENKLYNAESAENFRNKTGIFTEKYFLSDKNFIPYTIIVTSTGKVYNVGQEIDIFGEKKVIEEIIIKDGELSMNVLTTIKII